MSRLKLLLRLSLVSFALVTTHQTHGTFGVPGLTRGIVAGIALLIANENRNDSKTRTNCFILSGGMVTSIAISLGSSLATLDKNPQGALALKYFNTATIVTTIIAAIWPK